MLKRQVSLTEDKIFEKMSDGDESEKDYLENYQDEISEEFDDDFMGHYNPDTEKIKTIHKYTEVFVQGMLLLGIGLCLYITLI